MTGVGKKSSEIKDDSVLITMFASTFAKNRRIAEIKTPQKLPAIRYERDPMTKGREIVERR